MIKPTIILFGGTADTFPIAEKLLKHNLQVTVSTASDFELNLPENNLLTRRIGKLNSSEIEGLIAESNTKLVIDASHPYAEELHNNILTACRETETELFRFARPESIVKSDNIIFTKNHEDAAAKAFKIGNTILLTTGSNNVSAYTKEAEKNSKKCLARILPRPESINDCKAAGLTEDCIIAQKGPFSTEQNIEHITKYNVDVIISKDGGEKGGLPEKAEAAEKCNCKLLIIKRPRDKAEKTFQDYA
ncbi:MAG: precorrin-6A reductase, partial [Planctomycetota bacterium]